MHKLKRPRINGKTSKVWYIVWREDGRSHRFSTGKADRVEAERVLARFVSAKPPQDFDVEDMAKAFVKARVAEGKSESNLNTSLRPILNKFGREDPTRLNQNKVRDYIKERSCDVKASTIERELATLRACLNWGEVEQWISRAPRFKIPTAPKTRRRFLSKSEFARLEAQIDTIHLKTFVSLAINTASRATKILQLKWTDVDFDAGLIKYPDGQHHNKRTQIIPMNKSLREDLELALQFAVGDYVVEFNGQPIKSIRKSFEKAVERAKLEDVIIHDLRRTAASWALQAGASFEDIAGLLGDDVKVVQKHYAQFSTKHIKGVVDLLG